MKRCLARAGIELTGSFNTANGVQALYSISTGGSNTASGFAALFGNTTGSFNAANGANALQNNTTGGGNVANGGFALFSNTSGINNVAEGFDALFNNTTGNSNIAIGPGAGGSLTTGSNNIDIGNQGVAAETNTIRIGTQGTQTATFIAGISGTPLGAGVAVRVNANGQLGSVASSARFKQDIQPMDKASEAILALKPVMFRYKKELDPDGISQFGLVAEEVEKVNPDLVVRDEERKDLHRALRSCERDVAQRIPQRAPQSAATGSDHRGFAISHGQQRKDFETTAVQQQKQLQVLTASVEGAGRATPEGKRTD